MCENLADPGRIDGPGAAVQRRSTGAPGKRALTDSLRAGYMGEPDLYTRTIENAQIGAQVWLDGSVENQHGSLNSPRIAALSAPNSRARAVAMRVRTYGRLRRAQRTL